MSKAALTLRDRVYDKKNRQFLLSKIADSVQANDLSIPSNCDGFGRIHHFYRNVDPSWINDPLPIDPACYALAIDTVDMIETQVFQLAACNVHCWYCFVPDSLKCANGQLSSWFSAEKMIDSYFKYAPDVHVLDLSGGNPELAPEWVLDSMRALERCGKADKVYLWSDDTLTTDFLFEMDMADIKYMASYPMYGKVCCFKGFDKESFAFNSKLPSEMFEEQLIRFAKYLELGFDLYGYITLTCSNIDGIDEKIGAFMDRLQKIHPMLPLRVIPLKIMVFTPTQCRMNPVYKDSLINQSVAVEAWKKMLIERFSEEKRNKKIHEVKIN